VLVKSAVNTYTIRSLIILIVKRMLLKNKCRTLFEYTSIVYYLPSLVTYVHQTIGFNQRIAPTPLSERNDLFCNYWKMRFYSGM